MIPTFMWPGYSQAGLAQLVLEPLDQENAIFPHRIDRDRQGKDDRTSPCHQRIYFRARFAKQGRPDVSMG